MTEVKSGHVIQFYVNDIQVSINTRGEQNAPMYTDITMILSPLKVLSHQDFIGGKTMATHDAMETSYNNERNAGQLKRESYSGYYFNNLK